MHRLLSRTIQAVAILAFAAGPAVASAIHQFAGPPADGASPDALVFGRGVLYGATENGGTKNQKGASGGAGTVFRLAAPGTALAPAQEDVLYNFPGYVGDSVYPAALVAETDNTLIGTAVDGGSGGSGTVFQLTPSASPGALSTEVILRDFSGADGSQPGTLEHGGNNILFGETSSGGSGKYGTVFSLTPPASPAAGWVFQKLFDFGANVAGGQDPAGKLAFDAAGNIYGTTLFGGTNQGDGVVYKLSPPAGGVGEWVETILHIFLGTDGFYPQGVTFGPDGALYGTTNGIAIGGTVGSVFRLAPPASAGGVWILNTIYAFTGPDGAYPTSSPVFSKQGNLFGATANGGLGVSRGCGSGCGTIYELSHAPGGAGAWTLTGLLALHPSEGIAPNTTPLLGGTWLYSTANEGGLLGNSSRGHGTVFRVRFPLSVP